MRRIVSGLIAASLVPLAASAQVPTSVPQPNLDRSVHCAALFALVAAEQKAGRAEALRYPPLAERGRAFFIETSLRLRDERGIPLESVGELYRNEIAKLNPGDTDPAARDARIAAEMPACKAMLDAAALPAPTP